MEELIKKAFLHVGLLGPEVQSGYCDLISPNGEINSARGVGEGGRAGLVHHDAHVAGGVLETFPGYKGLRPQVPAGTVPRHFDPLCRQRIVPRCVIL